MKVLNLSDGGKCSRCMQCCTDFLPMTNKEINSIRKYMRSHPNVVENIATAEDGSLLLLCPFISEKGCQVYEVRPAICRGFNCWDTEEVILANKEKVNQYVRTVGGVNHNQCELNDYKSLHLIFFNNKEYDSYVKFIFQHNKDKKSFITTVKLNNVWR